MYYKPTANEISITTANTVYNGKLCRLLNTSGSTQVITFTGNSVVYGTLSMLNATEIVVKKSANDTIQATGVLSTPIIFAY